MITEDYCNFEIAKLLKEKEFDGECIGYYWDMDKTFGIHYELLSYSDGNLRNELILAPTLQMAMKWLREKHKIGIFPSIYSSHSIYYSEKDGVKHSFGTAIISLSNYELMTNDIMSMPTYEEACEAAIKYCLENLI